MIVMVEICSHTFATIAALLCSRLNNSTTATMLCVPGSPFTPLNCEFFSHESSKSRSKHRTRLVDFFLWQSLALYKYNWREMQIAIHWMAYSNSLHRETTSFSQTNDPNRKRHFMRPHGCYIVNNKWCKKHIDTLSQEYVWTIQWHFVHLLWDGIERAEIANIFKCRK